MDLRATINKHRQTSITALSAIVLLMLAIAIHEVSGRPSPSASKAFYTDDDGQTLFMDAPGLATPFDHDGKQAVMAIVYTADHGRHRWVQYLQKCSDGPERKPASVGPGGSGPAPGQMTAGMPEMLIKRPGEEKWVAMSDPDARRIMQSAPPDGMGSGPLELALP